MIKEIDPIKESVDFDALSRVNDIVNELNEFESYKQNPYEFDKRVKEENGNTIFRYNEKGQCIGLDLFNFSVAASKLMKKIKDEENGKL